MKEMCSGHSKQSIPVGLRGKHTILVTGIDHNARLSISSVPVETRGKVLETRNLKGDLEDLLPGIQKQPPEGGRRL